MTSNDEEPAYFVEATQLLRWRSFRSPYRAPVRSDLTAAAEEMAGWLTDARRLNLRNHRPGWTSVINELLAALEQLGPGMAHLLRDEMAQIRDECGRGVDDVANERSRLLVALQGLLACLRGRKALAAAWSDFLASVQDEDVSYEECLNARLLFWNVAHIGGQDRNELSRHLCGILSNDGRQVALSRFALGDLREAEVRDFAKSATLTADERLRLVRRVLLDTGGVHHHVVWHMYTRAAIDEFQTQLGDLALYSGPWLKNVLEMEEIPSWIELPAELRNRGVLWSKSMLPDDEMFVLARVDLGRQHLGNAPEVAARTADAVVNLAKHRCGRTSNWTRLPGHWHVIDERIAGVSYGFREPRPETDVAPGLDAVIDEIEDLLGIATVRQFRAAPLSEWSETLRWWREASAGHDAGAILVGVRVLDLVASRVGLGSWEAYVRGYLQWASIRRELLGAIANVTHAGLNPDRDSFVEDEGLERIRQIIITNEAKSSSFNYVAAVASLHEIEQRCAQDRTALRRVRRLRGSLLDADQSRMWVNRIRDDWELQVRRLARVRDALAHGGPTTRDSVAVAARFAAGLVNHALYLAFEAALRDADITTWHRGYAQDQTRWRQRFNDGQNLFASLLPPADAAADLR